MMWFFISYMLIASFFRFFLLDVRPLGFTWDETAIGYNATTLLTTGRDEHQVALPLIFESFADFKPGLYIYATVPWVAVIQDKILAVRLASAISGVVLGLVWFVWFYRINKPFSIICSLLFAANPWLIHFSRGGWEANFNLLLVSLGLVLWTRKRFVLSCLFFVLSLYTYQASKLFTPLLLLGLIVIYGINLWKKQTWGLILFLVLSMPLIISFGTTSGRLKVSSVFSYTRSIEVQQKIATQDKLPVLSFEFQLWHAEIIDQARGVMRRWFNYWSPRFWFFEGDWTNMRHAVPYSGYMYFVELFLVTIGLLVFLRFLARNNVVLLWWGIISVIPAALSRDLVSGVRALPLSVFMIFLSALGFTWIYKKSKLLFVVCSLLFVFCIFRFLDLYFVHYPQMAADQWQYAYVNVAKLLNTKDITNYQKIIVSPKLGQPYIYMSYFLDKDKFDLTRNKQTLRNDAGDVSAVTAASNFEFRDIYWPKDRGLTGGRYLFVGDEFELPSKDIDTTSGARVTDILNYPDGKPALRVVEKL